MCARRATVPRAMPRVSRRPARGRRVRSARRPSARAEANAREEAATENRRVGAAMRSELASNRALVIGVFAMCAWLSGVLGAPGRAHAARRPRVANASSSYTEFAERVGRHAAPRRAKRNSFVRDAAERVGPAVVRIDSDSMSLKKAMPVASGGSSSNGKNASQKSNGRSGVIRGTGCGLVIDAEEGYVVTNSHVVRGEGNVKVTFIDGNVYDGEVKGVDTLTDIALIKLKPRAGHQLPVAKLGDSDHMEVGDYAIALGNPLGLDNSVTLGIISNVHRTSAELGITERRVDFVQTDCAINPGNSGGPLVNEFSEVVALNTAIRADAEGIGFAIPINTVKRVVGILAAGAKVPHPFIGIRMVDNFTANSAFGERGLELPIGTVIVDVLENSPAALAGLTEGDVIIAIDGVVMTGAQILEHVKVTPPGDSYEVTVFSPSAKDPHKHRRVMIRVGDLADHKTRSQDSSADRNVSPPGVGVRPPTIPRPRGA